MRAGGLTGIARGDAGAAPGRGGAGADWVGGHLTVLSAGVQGVVRGRRLPGHARRSQARARARGCSPNVCTGGSMSGRYFPGAMSYCAGHGAWPCEEAFLASPMLRLYLLPQL